MKDIKERTKSWWKLNLANFITVVGLFLTIVFIYLCLYHPEMLWLIAALIIPIEASDYIDGKIARRYGESLLGSILDRKRDRVFIFPSLIILAWHHRWKLEQLPTALVYAGKILIIITIILEVITLLTFFVGVVLKSIEIVFYNQKKEKLDLGPNEAGRDSIYCGFAVITVWIWSLTIEKYSGLPVIYFSTPLLAYGLGRMIWKRILSLHGYWERVFPKN
ncbi:hypothetical protein AMJ47_03295 [Parcubacteria bacterium DG_72]|nr:MAG: hypothetical protein AMJ47_03295 [Parcubacteria bacterium DG_72]